MDPPEIVQIQLRSSTQAEWLDNNPVLAEAEAGYETDTRRLKFGDGRQAWSALPYDLLPVEELRVFRGLFVAGTRYFPGQYVEGPDGVGYMARRKMVAQVNPAAGALWRKTSWGAAGSSSGGPAGLPEGSSLISEWEVATYGQRLHVVLFQDNLYYLAFDVARPFDSLDLLDEYDRGQWIRIGTGAGDTAPVDMELVLLSEDGRRITDENGQPITVD